MQGPPGAQRQEELKRTGDTIQIAQWLEVLGVRWGERAGPHHPSPSVVGCVPHEDMSQPQPSVPWV